MNVDLHVHRPDDIESFGVLDVFRNQERMSNGLEFVTGRVQPRQMKSLQIPQMLVSVDNWYDAGRGRCGTQLRDAGSADDCR